MSLQNFFRFRLHLDFVAVDILEGGNDPVEGSGKVLSLYCVRLEEYFFPEIKEIYEEIKARREENKELYKYLTKNIFTNISEDFGDKRKQGENEIEICEIIRKIPNLSSSIGLLKYFSSGVI